jgi:hypothetical protein
MRSEWSNISGEEGYTLVTALIIIALLSTLIGMIMLGIIVQNRLIQRDINWTKARYAAESGIYMYLSDAEHWDDHSEQTIELFSADSIYIELHRKDHGGYWLIESTASVGRQKKIVRVLVGEQSTDAFDHAIVLGDNRTPLILTGSTSVTGNIQTGSGGTQIRSFRGESFTGSYLGQTIMSDSTDFQAFDSKIVDRSIESFNKSVLRAGNGLTVGPGRVDLAHILSTTDQKLFYSHGNLILEGDDMVEFPEGTQWFVNGNLTIRGDFNFGRFTCFIARDTLFVHANLSGEHGLFYGGEYIQIDGRTSMSGQFYSKGDVRIEEGNYLNYPSVVYVQSQLSNETKKGRIMLGDQSRVDGLLLLADSEDEGTVLQDESLITLAQGSVLRGGVYSTSRTELFGAVEGSVVTHQFYFYRSPTVYLNWLKDAKVDVTARPDGFVLPIGFSKVRQFRMIYREEIKSE